VEARLIFFFLRGTSLPPGKTSLPSKTCVTWSCDRPLTLGASKGLSCLAATPPLHGPRASLVLVTSTLARDARLLSKILRTFSGSTLEEAEDVGSLETVFSPAPLQKPSFDFYYSQRDLLSRSLVSSSDGAGMHPSLTGSSAIFSFREACDPFFRLVDSLLLPLFPRRESSFSRFFTGSFFFLRPSRPPCAHPP